MTRQHEVTIIELSVYDNTVPLVAGYLQAYAQHDPEVADAFGFGILSTSLSIEPDVLLEDLVARESSIYAFSCYIWNMGVVKQVLGPLMAARPDALIVLGGPQVMNHYSEYVPEGESRVIVCNGEGERTFTEILREFLADEPAWSRVPGISFWSEASGVVDTENPPRIVDLDEIPSPFEAGLFDEGEYTFTVLETNRGCPFSCGFCFWGAATQSKVHKFEGDRVMRDIEWIAKNGIASVFIADANWGLSPRDVDLSRHLIDMKKEYGFPTSLVLAAAKNRPERVAEITDILVRGGLVTSQPISMQSVNGSTLELINRSNIREETYVKLQKDLREKNISSFIELIWPLPGETLQSFTEGIARLCQMGADTLTVYPQLLLHNTSLYRQRELMGIEVERVETPAAEADVVVATNWVTREECNEGTWFYYALHSLHNARGLYHVATYLDRKQIVSYDQLFSDAARYMRDANNPISDFFARSVDTSDNYSLLNVGKVAHMVLMDNRAEFDQLVAAFCRSQPWWSDRAVPALLDLDLLCRPYIYRMDVVEPGLELSRGTVHGMSGTTIDVEFAREDVAGFVDVDFLTEADLAAAGDYVRLRIEHPVEGKMPHPKKQSIEHNAAYCHVMIQRLRTLLPQVHVIDDVPIASAAGTTRLEPAS
ncbi:B12-binding domain-containing radical SAM protein [Actinoplanes sp. NPDC020271]|uniref:B12-binding domain-containing radical SAM protein n=1 Tax=Actinoplanes sp. NPDC020271 TaxID=3363896 RepID=UPI00379797D0